MLTEVEIERIARGLIDHSLPKPEWTHRAHSAAALWLLRRPDAMPGGLAPLIRAYNVATGVANTDTSGYHETITRASLRGAAAVLDEHRDLPLSAALASLMDGPLGDRAWPLAYWSEGLLFSTQARREWVEPDLAPLPWPG